MRRSVAPSSLALGALLLLAAPARLAAQEGAAPAAAPDSARAPLYERARQLVADGQGEAGRRLVDSLLAATPEGTPGYAEALWWRATLAADAEAGERDLRRLAIEYALSPRAAEALLRLGQLEVARGDRARAVAYLDRLGREYPTSPLAAQGDYWKGRLLAEQNDLAGACIAFASARRRLAAGDVELRNRLDYYGGQCPSDVAAVDTVRRDAMGRGTGPGVPGAARGDSAATTPRAGQAATGAAPERAPAGPPSTAPRTAPAERRAAVPESRGFSIQVAAFRTRAEAEQRARQLTARRFRDVRVAGDAAPFRLRLGSYPTRAAATAALRSVRAAGMRGAYVVEDER